MAHMQVSQDRWVSIKQFVARLATNQERFDSMMELQKFGIPQQEIARRLGVTVRTIQNWNKQGSCPGHRRRRKRRSLFMLVQSFGQLVRKREGHRLEDWKQQVAQRGFTEVQRFAKGLERDQEAVLAGLTLVYSNGQVEGHVNKLKLLKRTMYGRAGFALLRQKVLHAL